MTYPQRPLILATRGSALALAQANLILAQCQTAFPEWQFEIRTFKTTGDKLQTASLAQEGHALPKGLFTKELEVALLNHEADLAVHSLKDLPTDLPNGLTLGAVAQRADVRDVLIYRDAQASHTPGRRGFGPNLRIRALPDGAVVATSSTRRKAQLLAHNPGLKTPDIRGNVATRLQKIADQPGLDATILALAGMNRLGFRITEDGRILGDAVPPGLLATVLDITEMLPCVGQGAIGIEIRSDDERLAAVCQRLNHDHTFQAVTAERAFLAAMGGGCQSPVAAFAEVSGHRLSMRALSFATGPMQNAEGEKSAPEAAELGRELAAKLKPRS